MTQVEKRDTERPTGAQRVARALKRHNVEVIFGQSLPSQLILAAEDIGIRQYVYRTENAAGAMADAYARVSNKIGVVAAQNGPAATLLVAPLAEALKSSIPILALVQEVNRSQVDRNAFQELDHLKLFDGCAKYVKRLNDAGRVEDYVDAAIVAATSGRPGPAVLLFPADLLAEHAAPTPFKREAALGHWPLDRCRANSASIDEAVRLLCNAEHPLVVAGGGVHCAQACDSLTKLQEAAHLPVAHTTMGKGVVSDEHPLSVGLIGNVMGHRSVGHYSRELVERSDAILLVGTRTNQNGTDSWSLFPKNADIIHIDIDGQEIGRTYEPTVRILGDAKLALDDLVLSLQKLNLSKREQARAIVEDDIAKFRKKHFADTIGLRNSDAVPIRPERIMNELNGVVDENSIVVADASYSSVWITALLEAAGAPQRFITPRGLAGLGWGYPMALGAKLARPNSDVYCVAGDGGFGHCWSELETATRERTKVVLIVLNNSVLGYQKDAETVKFGRYTSACHFQLVDHASIAEACGVRAFRVENPDELAVALNKAREYDGPVLIDVLCDPEAFPPLTMFDDQLVDAQGEHRQ